VISSGKATLMELETYYGCKDAYDLIHIILVDAENQKAMIRKQEQDAAKDSQ